MTVVVRHIYFKFKDKLAVNDVIKLKGITYIVLKIGRVKMQLQGCYACCALQEVHSKPVSQLYDVIDTPYRFAPLSAKTHKTPWEAGDLIQLQGTGVAVKVLGLKDFHYDFTDFVVHYDLQIIQEYPAQVVRQILREHRHPYAQSTLDHKKALKNSEPQIISIKITMKTP
ncbi:MAG: hypothetical protein [Caudoviricetes sp.]|nr:MAG: hypothetical protein [Caudoviricetes sp.]